MYYISKCLFSLIFQISVSTLILFTPISLRIKELQGRNAQLLAELRENGKLIDAKSQFLCQLMGTEGC